MIAPVLFPADTLIGLALESPVAGYTFSGGDYDGIYRQDYAYIDGLGNLAPCNGMQADGVYGYYITETYPYIIGHLKGTMHADFCQ